LPKRLFSQEQIRQALSDSVPVQAVGPDAIINNIVELVCRDFQVEPEEIYSRSLEPWIVKARYVAIFLSQAEASLSMRETGGRFDRDHTSVTAAISRVMSDSVLLAFAASIRAQLTYKENTNDSST